MAADQSTRGIGVYPGDPADFFGPQMRIDATTYRNLAFRRAAYGSSSYNYNLTPQLITDGIRTTAMPRYVTVRTSDEGIVSKVNRELLLDDVYLTEVDFKAARSIWIEFELGGDEPPEIDHIRFDGSVRVMQPETWTCIVSGSEDGHAWKELGRSHGGVRPSGDLRGAAPFTAPARNRFYRVELRSGRTMPWRIGEVTFFHGGDEVHLGGPYNFDSAWMSAGSGEEWVYVDLGAPCTFDRVALYWVRRAAEGSIQVSDDAAAWSTIQPLPGGSGPSDDIHLAQPAHGRYVRVLMTRPAAPEGYVLSELEVYGRGGPIPVAHPAATPRAGETARLAGGAWKIERANLVAADGAALSQAGFDDRTWLPATVPGTALVSYLNAGAIPDPYFGDNLLQISDSFFQSDFWYRDEFAAPAAAPGRRVWLNFDGINWKATVWLNGQKLGRIEGGFLRARFDVTAIVHAGQPNALAVLVEKTAHPGSVKQKTAEATPANGGVLGADNPTFHASIGWDWIPTIPGRDTGIWNDVFLSASGGVTIENPFAHSTLALPDISHADVTVEVTLRNHESQPVSGTLRGRFGDVPFEAAVSLDANAAKVVTLDPSTTPALRLANPRLWWPNGYGSPDLYSVQVSFEVGGAVSDSKAFQTGVRQFTYSEEGGILRMWINGRRFIPRGGNWGFSEALLRYRAREYETAVRYHRDMNFTMIRNWVGQIGEDAFYDACDRNGIVVWQDFWLANPYDGPDPDDDAMFLRNAEDTILRVRNHPSMGLYVGRNEGFPPEIIDTGLRSMIAHDHPGLHYIPSSADDAVAGRGPYQVQAVNWYFRNRATTKLHSEMGMPNIVTLDSLKLMMPESGLWPQGLMWGLHDFCARAAQNAISFRSRIQNSYGGADNVAEWVELAQFVNYEGHRAMYEAQSANRMGLLIWMSHPCWPSLVWQTYDYYFEPTAAYFGAKKASEPLHIQWNAASDNVEVVNYSGGNQTGLTASVRIFNLDGSLKWEKSAAVDSSEDSTVKPIHMEYPAGLSPVHFLRLQLTQNGRVISDNFYWRGAEGEDYRALRELPKASLSAASQIERRGDGWRMTTELRNTSTTPALMIRLKAVRSRTGDRILPAFYSDNYVSLMPGESRTITTDFANADTRGETARMVLEGFNLK